MAPPTIQNRGLLLSSFSSPLELVGLPLPSATIGSVVVSVLATYIAPYASKIYNGEMGFNLPLPTTPGFGCIGRIHATGPDAVKLQAGDLVFVDPTVHGRDNVDVAMLLGHFEGMQPESRALMDKVWRNGTLQKFVAVPLENCVWLDETRLCKELAYSPADLMTLLTYAIAAGPLIETANLQAGETIVVGPASGTYSGAAVEIALALGANVVALGRSEEKLAHLRTVLGHSKRLTTAVMTGIDESDVAMLQRLLPHGADVHNNWSPTGSTEALYLGPVAAVLKHGARVVLSGHAETSQGLPYGLMVLKDLTVAGKLMYSRKTVERLFEFVASGFLEVGERSGAVVRSFELERFDEALEAAAKNGTWKDYTIVTLNKV